MSDSVSAGVVLGSNSPALKVEIQQVSVVLGKKTVLSDLSFSVPNGASVAIVGQSGRGKTTLLRAIEGWVKPSTGSILIDGLTPESHYGTAKLGFLFQEAELWEHLIVRKHLELVYTIHRRPPDSRQINAQLESVGLREAQDLYPYQLSVGMKTRVAIARALCLHPQLLLMDEPFAALDQVMRTKLNKVVRESCRKLNATSIWVTHDVVEALMFADFVVAMTPTNKVEIFETGDLPAIADSGALPQPVLGLRDRIINTTWGQSTAESSPKMNA